MSLSPYNLKNRKHAIILLSLVEKKLKKVMYLLPTYVKNKKNNWINIKYRDILTHKGLKIPT